MPRGKERVLGEDGRRVGAAHRGLRVAQGEDIPFRPIWVDDDDSGRRRRDVLDVGHEDQPGGALASFVPRAANTAELEALGHGGAAAPTQPGIAELRAGRRGGGLELNPRPTCGGQDRVGAGVWHGRQRHVGDLRGELDRRHGRLRERRRAELDPGDSGRRGRKVLGGAVAIQGHVEGQLRVEHGGRLRQRRPGMGQVLRGCEGLLRDRRWSWGQGRCGVEFGAGNALGRRHRSGHHARRRRRRQGRHHRRGDRHDGDWQRRWDRHGGGRRHAHGGGRWGGSRGRPRRPRQSRGPGAIDARELGQFSPAAEAELVVVLVGLTAVRTDDHADFPNITSW